jgi:hypothetical protein
LQTSSTSLARTITQEGVTATKNRKYPSTETNYVWGKCRDGCRDPGLESDWEYDEGGQYWIHKYSRKTVRGGTIGGKRIPRAGLDRRRTVNSNCPRSKIMRAKRRTTVPVCLTRARPATRLREVFEVLVDQRGTTSLPNIFPKIQRFSENKRSWTSKLVAR